jgi:hypothetical protein
VKIRTGWISPARTTTGRDHLGVQAVSDRLYSDLLPGITNVTSRIRCYSFYPWFVSEFDRRVTKKSAAELIRLFRRAECLHTIIGISHELKHGSPAQHGRSLTGRRKLGAVSQQIRDGKTIRLSDYADLDADADERYFKNELGGLGQYYLGPLKDLMILDGDASSGVKYTAEWGRTLAVAHGRTVDSDAFFETIQSDRVSRDTVSALESFCSCRLRKNKAERDALVALMLSEGQGDFRQESGNRRLTLLLLLDYAQKLEESDFGVVVPGFLNGCYSGMLRNGRRWEIPAALIPVRDSWAVYLKHELLSISAQALFWAGLQGLRNERGNYIQSVEAYASWFAERFARVFPSRDRTTALGGLIEKTAGGLPPRAQCDHEAHELVHADKLVESHLQDDIDGSAKAAIAILLALLARGHEEPEYGLARVTPAFLQTYEINLESLHSLAKGEWRALPATAWIERLASDWGLRVHFRVALRKLRYQTEDTFQIVPRDDGLHVRTVPIPQWSTPRLGQAHMFLADLGALSVEPTEDGGECFNLTPFGRELLETSRGQG